MNRIMWIVGGAVWSVLVFGTTFRLTFPSDEVSDFLAHHVRERSGGQYDIEMESVSPWWIGLSASRFVASSADPSGVMMPFFMADEVSARVGLLGLLTKSPDVTARVQMQDAMVDVVAQTHLEDGRMSIDALAGTVDDMPLEDLITLAGGGGGVDISSRGTLDVKVDVDMSDGPEKARGDISIFGSDIRLESVAAESFGLAEMALDTPVDELDIRLRGDEGLFEVTRGVFVSSLIEAEIEGEITLSEPVDRSRVALTVEVEIGDWSETPLASFQAMAQMGMKSAQWSDERYHYTVDGTLGRIGSSSFRPARDPNPVRAAAPTPSRYTPPSRTLGTDPVKRPESPSRAATRPLARDEELELDDEFEDEEFEDEELEDDELEDGEEELDAEIEDY